MFGVAVMMTMCSFIALQEQEIEKMFIGLL